MAHREESTTGKVLHAVGYATLTRDQIQEITEASESAVLQALSRLQREGKIESGPIGSTTADGHMEPRGQGYKRYWAVGDAE